MVLYGVSCPETASAKGISVAINNIGKTDMPEGGSGRCWMERTLLPRRHHVQRFGSALNLNPHSHVVMLDGVYASDKKGAAPVFVPASPLRDTDVQRIVETAAHRLLRLLQQRGVLDETDGDLP